jgi:dethiobiotin synthetase
VSGRAAVVVVTGTGTEVGKTWVAAEMARRLRARGVAVAARKPVQSFAPTDPTTDADVLAAATGEPPSRVCPPHRSLPCPMAPPMAAEALGRPPFRVADLVAELALPERGLVLVEGAGGVASPLAADGDTAALADALAPAAVVLVAGAGLGTINLVRLAAAALPPHRVVVVLNRFDRRDDLHARNRDWLATREGLEVVTDPEALAGALAPLATS